MRFLFLVAAIAAAAFIGREYLRKKVPEGREAVVRAAAGQGRITLYTTAWCGSCRQARTYLNQRGIDYVEKDVERSQLAASELAEKRRAAGIRTRAVPVLDVDGRLLVGFDPRSYDRVLRGM
jgi:arsenate reductase-like glutaredoxin family protein